MADASLVGDEGGVIAGRDGIFVGVPAGAFDEPTTISISAQPESFLPYDLPDGWNFHGAAQLEWSGELAAHPLSLDFPAPAGKVAGDTVYLFQPVDVFHDNGTIDRAWEIVDRMQVGNDGRMRTTSPPNLGVYGT